MKEKPVRLFLASVALTLLFTSAASAKVVMNAAHREAQQAKEAEFAADVEAGMTPAEIEQKRAEPNNALTATIYAAESKLKEFAAGVESNLQQNTVANIQKDLDKAIKKGDKAKAAELQAQLDAEKAAAAEAQKKVDEHAKAVDENLVKAKTMASESAAAMGGEAPPIPGFEEDE